MVYIVTGMKILFNKTVSIDVSKYPNDTYVKSFRRNESLEAMEVVPVSRGFVNITLLPGNPLGECLIDVRKDCFTVVE